MLVSISRFFDLMADHRTPAFVSLNSIGLLCRFPARRRQTLRAWILFEFHRVRTVWHAPFDAESTSGESQKILESSRYEKADDPARRGDTYHSRICLRSDRIKFEHLEMPLQLAEFPRFYQPTQQAA
jgi:hypothetical protein